MDRIPKLNTWTDWIFAIAVSAAAATSILGTFLGSIRLLGAALSIFIAQVAVDRFYTPEKLDSLVKSADSIERLVRPIFESAQSGTAASKYTQISAKYLLRPDTKVSVGGATIKVHRLDAIELWRDCLVESSKWSSLSFAPDLWEDDEGEVSLAYHQLRKTLAKKGERGSIRRVFVTEDMSQLGVQRVLISKLIGFDVDTRWIEHDELRSRAVDSGWGNWPVTEQGLIRDLDFALIDDSFVLRFELRDNRKLAAAELTKDPAVVKLARTLFGLALSNGHEFKRNGDPIRTTPKP